MMTQQTGLKMESEHYSVISSSTALMERYSIVISFGTALVACKIQHGVLSPQMSLELYMEYSVVVCGKT